MSLKTTINSLFATVTVRLTVYYVGFFALVSLAVFILFYFMLTARLEQSINKELLAEANEIAILYESEGLDELLREFEREADSKGADKAFFLLLSPHLQTLISSDLRPWQGVDFTSGVLESLAVNDEVFGTISVPGKHYTTKRISKKAHDGNIIQIGYMFEDEARLLVSYLKVFGMAIMIMLFCGGLIGFFVTREAMSGVNQITQIAMHIGEGDLNCRVPVHNKGKEIDSLASAFNDMLARIELLVCELKEVTSNIAHDLRSPLTRIRGFAETTLTGKQSIDEYRSMAAVVIEESDRLVGMINTMLEIAETESGIAGIDYRPVDVTKVVDEAYELFYPVAEEKNIGFTKAVPPESLMLRGDIARIQRVIANVLDNAFKYTSAGGSACIALQGTPSRVTISVTNSGAGIDEKDLPYIFDRFYRGDASRSTSGNGLGLSLVKSIVKAHSGNVNVRSTIGCGTTVEISLPRILPA